MANPFVPLRVLSWNILEGWHRPRRKKGETPQMQVERFHAARALIQEQSPDVVVLNEALWCRPFMGHFVDYGSLLGYEHVFCDTYDGAWGNAILSRFPFEDSHRFRIHNRGGLRATVQCDGWQATIATYHPHPSRYPHNKASDYIALIPEQLDHPLVLCGDFNAISPEDNVDMAVLAAAFARFSKHPQEDLQRFTTGGEEVFSTLASIGLRDGIDPLRRRYTIPTDLLSKDKSSAMRIDHAWVNVHARVLNGEVLQHPLADIASDHYPIILDIVPREGV